MAPEWPGRAAEVLCGLPLLRFLAPQGAVAQSPVRDPSDDRGRSRIHRPSDHASQDRDALGERDRRALGSELGDEEGITAGQCADCTQFEAVMNKISVPRLTAGRPRTRPDSASADKAYSNRRTRRYLCRHGIRHVIPEKADQAAGRIRRGRTGGRPPGFNKERYKKRNTVERAINKLKTFRAVATRYDKRGYVFVGTVTAAALVIRLRS
ncbi:transposase [Kitasatospora griseola]|uniref:transposase n=1 Tax=Kitasatospora griseola TaxID=2064 RepID=UPI0038556959